jgi:hypothetical protein
VTADDHTNLSRLNKGKPFSPSAQAAAKPMKAGIGEDKADKATVEKAEAGYWKLEGTWRWTWTWQ